VGSRGKPQGGLALIYSCWVEGARATEDSIPQVLWRRFDTGVSQLSFQQSLVGNELDAASQKAQAYLRNVLDKIRNAADWDALNKLAAPILGSTSMSAGVLYGVFESLAGDAVSLLSLGKMIVLTGIYERIKNNSMTLVLDPTSLALAITVRTIPALWNEARKCDEAFWGLVKELLEIAAHPFKFIEVVGKNIYQGAKDDWNKLNAYAVDRTVTGDFQAGCIIGRVLYQVVMAILLVMSVAGAVAKIAARFPWLIRLARYVKSGGELAELGEVAEGGAKAAEGVVDAAKASETAEASVPKPKKIAEPVEEPAPQSPDGTSGAKAKKQSLREKYLGRTPGKNSRAGLEVQDRMRAAGKLRENVITGETEFQASDNNWYPLDEADMSHTPTDAVRWWNDTGREYGAKSPEVREWMLDSDNYTLDHYSLNRSAGAKLPDTYLPPLK